jgi:hypothetical protein
MQALLRIMVVAASLGMVAAQVKVRCLHACACATNVRRCPQKSTRHLIATMHACSDLTVLVLRGFALLQAHVLYRCTSDVGCMQVPFEGEVELPLKGHLTFRGTAMVPLLPQYATC